ncbi:TIGR01841 family phasin [Nitrobacter sp. JJSN]|uniref:TIGR01841 family phasin n=1 Tax=Nitrobacter sp. JJSN TaxID=3453033 RepID=UPI003F76FE99
MANRRPEDKSTQGVENAARRAGEKAAEQTTRIGQAAAEAGEQVARAGADLLKQNVDTLQNTCSGLEAATSVMGRSSEQFGRTLGLSGEEAQKATEATERSARTAQTLLYSGTAAARVMGGMSQEYLQMVRHQIENNISHLNRLWTCRTPQDFAALQSDMVRETVETALESSRRIADMSLKMVNATGEQIKQTMEQIRRVA